jgi:hypothetical protein
MTRTALYRHYDVTGRLLYVGITNHLTDRDARHRAVSDWFHQVQRSDTQWCVSREHALALERVAIEFEKPIHNKAHSAPIAPVVLVKPKPNAAAGDALKQFLKANRIRQTDFARRIGVGQSNVCKYIALKVIPSIDTAVAIEAETLGCVPVSLWRKTHAPTSAPQYPVSPVVSVGAV